MNFDKYIDWYKLWEDEITLDFIYHLSDEEKIILEQFKSDDRVQLLFDECNMQIIDGDDWEFVFQFSETGGQNESDTQGWSRDYVIVIDQDYFIKEISYEQG